MVDWKIRIRIARGGKFVSEMSHREALVIKAFRRNSDNNAERLRREVPILLGRLVAEVPHSMIELSVHMADDGIVCGKVAVEAGASTSELRRGMSTVLEPIAELDDLLEDPTAGWVAWPLVAAERPAVGFQVGPTTEVAPVEWNCTQSPDLVQLVSTHADSGIRIRLKADGLPEQWRLDAAVLTRGAVPTLRLRAHIRTEFPGFSVAAEQDAHAAVVRLGVDRLDSLFALPVGGPEPMPGVYVAAAAPLPIHPVRQTICPSISVRLGSAVMVAGQHVPVLMGDQERLRHMHVVGRTGTGKSTFLAGIAHEVARKGDGVLVLDPHGHLVDRILAELPDTAAGRTWMIRCGDVNNPVPLNPMAVDDQVRREIAIDDVCRMFQYLFDKKSTGIVGPRFRERVAMALRALVAVFGTRASLLDVPAALADPKFMAKAVEAAADDRLKAWLTNDLANRRSGEYADLVSWVNSKFEAFASTTAMRGILGSGEDAVDMTDTMDDGRIVLVDLSKSTLGESATSLLGFLYLNRVWTSALQRRNTERPYTVIVDEAQSLISGSLTAMLAEGRKFGLSVVLAHQYLGQLDDDLRPALDGNVATTVAFRGAAADALEVRRRFGDRVDTATLMTLPDLSAIILRTAIGVVSEPHTLIVDHNDRISARCGEAREDFEASVSAATARDLVDDYRSRTSVAAAGRSNVVGALAESKRPAPPKPAALKPDADDATRPDSFDEWFARRVKAALVKSDGEASKSA